MVMERLTPEMNDDSAQLEAGKSAINWGDVVLELENSAINRKAKESRKTDMVIIRSHW